MSRKRELQQRDSVLGFDDDGGMIPTEPADSPLVALPAQGGFLAQFSDAGSAAAASFASHFSAVPALVHALQSDGEMLGAIQSLVEATNRGRTGTETHNLATQDGNWRTR